MILNKRLAAPGTCRLRPAILGAIVLSLLSFTPSGAPEFARLQASAEGPLALTPGASLARGIGKEGVHVFGLSLSAGQYLQIVIEKGDLNLSLAFFGPHGEKLAEDASSAYETLDFSAVAESSGAYKLEVRSFEHDESSRPYKLLVEPLRSATAKDLGETNARAALAAAKQLRGDWKEASLRKAIEKYLEASSLWRSLGDLRGAARATLGAAETYLTLGEYREALSRYRQAASEAGLAHDKLIESAALSRIGRLSSYLGDNDAAQRYLAQAGTYDTLPGGAAPLLPVKDYDADKLSSSGEVYYAKGDLVKSAKSFARALELFHELGDRKGEARVRLFVGYLNGGLGDPEKAVAEISQALALARATGDKALEGLALTALGLSHSLKREEEQAITMHGAAREIFRTIGDRQSEGITMNALGQAYENLSEFKLALDNYQEALRLFQASGNLDFSSVAIYQIAGVYRLSGDSAQALTAYEQCIRLSRAAKKTRTEANALKDVAAIYATQGNRERTLSQYRKLLSFYGAIGDRRGQAIALNNLGDFFFTLQEKKKALSAYEQALSFSEQGGEKGVQLSTLYNLARVQLDGGDLEGALSRIKDSIRLIEELRSNVASPDFRTSYFSGVRRHYELYMEILMELEQLRPEQGFAGAALLVSENGRARSLNDLLAEARADIRQGVAPELLARERELEGLLRSQAQYYLEISSSGKNLIEAAEVARDGEMLRAEYQNIETRIRDRNPRYLALTQPPPLTVAEIQGQLRDENTMLLEYALGEKQSYLWAVTANSLRTYKLPSRAILEAAANEVYQLITARERAGAQTDVAGADALYRVKALALSEMLLGQAADQLGNKRLIFVTEGALQYVALDALPQPTPLQLTNSVAPAAAAEAAPLIAAHEIVMLPSISTLAAIRLESRPPSLRNRVVAVLADPVFSLRDERLHNGQNEHQVAAGANAEPGISQRAFRDFEKQTRGGGLAPLGHTGAEADAILAVTPAGTWLVARGFDATREAAMSSQVGEYQILHLATHGFINSEHPELSGMVLTMFKRDGTQTNGFLPLRDVYNLKLSANLTVLSACDTALGQEVKGEGLIGLTRGFMYAGSKSVVASLWKVDDRATALLMGYFYEAMLRDGLPPAAALRSAKQRMRQQKDWEAPYFWAGFVLQGEYSQRIEVEKNSRPRIWLAAGSLLVVIFSLSLFFLRRRAARVI